MWMHWIQSSLAMEWYVYILVIKYMYYLLSSYIHGYNQSLQLFQIICIYMHACMYGCLY